METIGRKAFKVVAVYRWHPGDSRHLWVDTFYYFDDINDRGEAVARTTRRLQGDAPNVLIDDIHAFEYDD